MKRILFSLLLSAAAFTAPLHAQSFDLSSTTCSLNHGFRFEGGYGPDQATLSQVHFQVHRLDYSRIADGYDKQDLGWSYGCDRVRMLWTGSGGSPSLGASCYGGTVVPPGTPPRFLAYTDVCGTGRRIMVRLPGIGADWPAIAALPMDMLGENDYKDQAKMALYTLNWKPDFTMEVLLKTPGKPDRVLRPGIEKTYMLRARMTVDARKDYTMSFYRLMVSEPRNNGSSTGPAVSWEADNGHPLFLHAQKTYDVQVFLVGHKASAEQMSKVQAGLYKFGWPACTPSFGAPDTRAACAISPMAPVSVNMTRRLTDLEYPMMNSLPAPAFLTFQPVLTGFSGSDVPEIIVRAKPRGTGAVREARSRGTPLTVDLTGMEGTSYDLEVRAAYQGVEHAIGTPAFTKIVRKGVTEMNKTIPDAEYQQADEFWTNYTIGKRQSVALRVPSLRYDAFPRYEIHITRPASIRRRVTVTLDASGMPGSLKSVELVRKADGKVTPLVIAGPSASAEVEGAANAEFDVRFTVTVNAGPAQTGELTQDRTKLTIGRQVFQITRLAHGESGALPGTPGWNTIRLAPNGGLDFKISAMRILPGMDKFRPSIDLNR